MDLYYQSVGQGTPIIFVHGFSLDSRMWQPQIEEFSKTNQVITYDLRGFGNSPLPTTQYSHHVDLYNLAKYLKLPKFHLVGLSLGGEIAIDYALTYPEALLSLTLADTSLGGYASTVDWRVYAKEQGLKNAKENWLDHPVFSTTKTKPEVFSQLKQMVEDYSGWHWLNEDSRLKLSPPATDRLGEIKISTQVLVGEKDLDYYHTIADILADTIKDSRLEYINDSGHIVNLESPEEFNAVLSRFIAK